MNTRWRLLCNKSSTAHQPKLRFKTALSYVTFLFSEWRIGQTFLYVFLVNNIKNLENAFYRLSLSFIVPKISRFKVIITNILFRSLRSLCSAPIYQVFFKHLWPLLIVRDGISYDVLNHNGGAFRMSPSAFWGYVHNLPDWFLVRLGNRSDAIWIMLWKIKLYRTGPELNCSHRTRSICSIFVSIWQKKPSLDSKRVITRFHSKSNQLNSPFTSGTERSEKLSDMEHITFGIGAFQVIVTKIVPDQLDHMLLTERSLIGFQKHSDNRSDMVLPPPPPPPPPQPILVV